MHIKIYFIIYYSARDLSYFIIKDYNILEFRSITV